MSDDYKAAQAKLMLEQASDVDVIITTALIPGRKAPVLVNQEMLDVMKAGSVLVDLAAANGGNVAQTEANKVITTENGVTIIGYTDLPSRLASTSSTLVSLVCVPKVELHIIHSFLTWRYLFLYPVWKQRGEVHSKHRSPNDQRKGSIPN